jgi:hypothetical protein
MCYAFFDAGIILKKPRLHLGITAVIMRRIQNLQKNSSKIVLKIDSDKSPNSAQWDKNSRRIKLILAVMSSRIKIA